MYIFNLEHYDLDLKLMTYWLVAIISLGLALSFFIMHSPFDSDRNNQEASESSESIDLNIQDLMADQATRLKVVRNGEPVEGAYIYIDGSYIGLTNSEGYRSFRVPESDFTVEIEREDIEAEETFTPEIPEDDSGDQDDGSHGSQDGSDDSLDDPEDGSQEDSGDQDDSEDQDGSDNQEGSDDETDEPSDGIGLLSEPQAEEANVIEVFENGDPVIGLEVTINGESVGVTDNLGQVQFQVPDTENIEINAEGFEASEFNVSGVSGENYVNLEQPSNSAEIMTEPGTTENIDFEFETPEQASYTLFIDDNSVADGEGGNISVQQSLSPGSHSWYVESEREGIITSNTRNLEINENGSSIEIIEEGTESDYDEATVTFRIEGQASEYRVTVNGEQKVQEPVGTTESYSQEFSAHGDQNFLIEALEDGETTASREVVLTTQQMPQADITWLNPDTADTTQPETEVEIDVSEEYEYSLEITDSQGGFHGRSGSAQGTDTFTYTPGPLPQGTHNYNITAEYENEQIGESTGTFETTAERALVEGEFNYRYSSQVSQHQILMDMEAYENLEYSITVDGEQRVSEEFTGSTTTRAEDIGSLESGQSYTATINFESLETSKTHEETVEFTAE